MRDDVPHRLIDEAAHLPGIGLERMKHQRGPSPAANRGRLPYQIVHLSPAGRTIFVDGGQFQASANSGMFLTVRLTRAGPAHEGP